MSLFSKALRTSCVAATLMISHTTAVLSQTSSADTASAPIVPAETFAALPDITDLKLSPNGQQVAFMTSRDGRTAGQVQNMNGSAAVIVPPVNSAEIFRMEWVNDD